MFHRHPPCLIVTRLKNASGEKAERSRTTSVGIGQVFARAYADGVHPPLCPPRCRKTRLKHHAVGGLYAKIACGKQEYLRVGLRLLHTCAVGNRVKERKKPRCLQNDARVLARRAHAIFIPRWRSSGRRVSAPGSSSRSSILVMCESISRSSPVPCTPSPR